MNDDFGVARALKDGTAMLEPAAHFQRIGQIPVVSKRQLSLIAIDHHGLRVHQRCIACRRITRVADGCVARELRNHTRCENILHVAETLVHMDIHAIRRSNAGRFLSAVLQCVESQVGQFRGLRMPKNPEDAAMIVKMIVVDLYQAIHARVARASIALSIQSAQILRNEWMSPWTTGVPLYWMRNSPRETVPIG